MEFEDWCVEVLDSDELEQLKIDCHKFFDLQKIPHWFDEQVEDEKVKVTFNHPKMSKEQEEEWTALLHNYTLDYI